VQIGAMVTKVVTGAAIRAFYAITILAGFSNRVCALIRKLSDMGYIALSRETAASIETVGTVIFFGFLSIFGVWVLGVFFKNLEDFRNPQPVRAAFKSASTNIPPESRK
jgi:hypothetical protein